MKIDFKPQDNRRFPLFKNWGEAAVFWLSLAGLILFAIIITLRSIDRNKTRNVFREFRTEQQQILQKIEFLEEQNEELKKQNDSLRTEYQQLKSGLISAKPQPLSPSRPSQVKPQTDQERNRSKFLNTSKGK